MKLLQSILLFSAFALFGCTPQPEPIKFGTDQCTYCKMGIADPKFGAELVTAKGRIHKFDALECLVPYLDAHPDEYLHTLAIAYDDPEVLHPVQDMTFVISTEIKSPMGAWLLSFTSGENAAPYTENGKAYNWESLQYYLLNEAN